MADIQKVLEKLQSRISELYLENVVLKIELDELRERLTSVQEKNVSGPIASD